MFLYCVFGHILESDFSLSPCVEFKPKSLEFEKVRITAFRSRETLVSGRPFHTLYYANHKVYARFFRYDREFEVRFPGQGKFRISSSGNRIECLFDQSLSSAEKTILLVNHVLPLALSLKNCVILHGASIAVGKNSVHAILGNAGTGKSTIAAHLHHKKFRVFSDDAVIVMQKNSKFYTSRAAPVIRLHKPGMSTKVLAVLEDVSQTRWQRLTGLHFPVEKSLRSLRQISTIESIQALLPQIFRLDVMSSHRSVKEFDFITRLCASVPAFEWSYKHNRAALTHAQKMLVTAERLFL